jgi:ubiquinone/menaquinone biosynthesis C-methylase UbiE
VTTPEERGAERYVHGYEEWTREWMARRTASSELGFLLPHLSSGLALLDCGCGPGSITLGLAEIVAPGQVVGLDLEPRQLEAAKGLAAERAVSNVRFQQGSVYELPFPDATFDAAVAHFVLEHVSDPLHALREIRRVLRPGGVVAIKDPYYPAFTFRPETAELRLFGELSEKVRAYSGASDRYAPDLRAYLREAGFARTEARAGVENVAGTDAAAGALAMMLQNQVREAAFRDTVLGQGWATEADLDGISAAAPALAADPDLFGFVVWVSALGWVAS